MSLPVVMVFTQEMIFLSLYEPIAELKGPLSQVSLTSNDFDTDSAMGISIFTDDRSTYTFATDEEVSEFVCIYSYLTIQG